MTDSESGFPGQVRNDGFRVWIPEQVRNDGEQIKILVIISKYLVNGIKNENRRDTKDTKYKLTQFKKEYIGELESLYLRKS